MSVMLFRLRGVAIDEAEELRQVLSENDIRFYETPADRWGVSMPGIWLKDDSQLEQAQNIVKQYQSERSDRVRGEMEQLKREGRAETFIRRLKENPFMIVVYLIMLGFAMYFFLVPFLYFAQ